MNNSAYKIRNILFCLTAIIFAVILSSQIVPEYLENLPDQKEEGRFLINQSDIYLKASPVFDGFDIKKLSLWEEVDPVERASEEIKIGDLRGHWVKVTLMDGTSGFVFSPYLSYQFGIKCSQAVFGFINDNSNNKPENDLGIAFTVNNGLLQSGQCLGISSKTGNADFKFFLESFSADKLIAVGNPEYRYVDPTGSDVPRFVSYQLADFEMKLKNFSGEYFYIFPPFDGTVPSKTFWGRQIYIKNEKLFKESHFYFYLEYNVPGFYDQLLPLLSAQLQKTDSGYKLHEDLLLRNGWIIFGKLGDRYCYNFEVVFWKKSAIYDGDNILEPKEFLKVSQKNFAWKVNGFGTTDAEFKINDYPVVFEFSSPGFYTPVSISMYKYCDRITDLDNDGDPEYWMSIGEPEYSSQNLVIVRNNYIWESEPYLINIYDK